MKEVKMDISARKLNLISYIAELKDEKFFKQIEKYILEKQPEMTEPNFKPFTVEELVSRAQKSLKDLNDGNFKTQEELEKLSANW